ncbi:MAG: redox-sensing transcriptional repressor Rex [Clostridiales bacterium]|nr:redox-sensing transcriptional repressor Rex [Clostridiales bacterium]
MKISYSAVKRLPSYLRCLKEFSEDTKNVSSRLLAEKLGLGEILVRKDLSAISGEGKPRIGYDRKTLISVLEETLGYNSENSAVLVGAGKLGSALLDYGGFAEAGIRITAAFDNDIKKIGVSEGGKYIYPLSDFEEFCRQSNVKIGIITVPADEAQGICDLMERSGLEAIWNFAPVSLKTDGGILIHNENMAESLALLSSFLKKRSDTESSED